MSSNCFQIFLLQSVCRFFLRRIHLPRSFAALIHDLYSLSVEFSVSFFSSLRNSLISSSHLLLGLPVALYVLYLELSSGFHSAAFTIHFSFGRDAILSLDPTSNLRVFHLISDFVCASFYVFNPVFFDLGCINFIIGIVFEGDVAVLLVVLV